MNEREIVLTVLEMESPDDRTRYIREVCGHNTKLRERVEQLLRASESMGGSFLESPAPVLLDAFDHGIQGAPGKNSVAADRLESRVLGDFRILREIGRGGMGVVYEAEQISLGRRVALKVLPFAAVIDDKQLQRFKNEAQAAAQLHHMNIVPVHAVGTDRGVHYYAMQFIEGQTLSEVIADLKQQELGDQSPSKQDKSESGSSVAAAHPNLDTSGRKSSPPETSREIQAAISTAHSTKTLAFCRSVSQLGVQVAEALDYAHEDGVVHRDVKPSNLIVDAKGKIWVMDFGLARVASEPGLTMTGDMLGTLRYMSPEQALAKRIAVDHRTDIYSLGVTLYELLTLRPAFPGKDREEILRRIAFEEPKPPRRFNKNVPVELETIVLKAMAKNPTERYMTAAELAEDLRCFLDDRPIHARRPTILQRATKWSRRHKAFMTAAAIIVILTTIGLGISNVLIAQQRNRAVDAGDRLRHANREVTDANNQIARLLASSFVNKAQSLCESGEIGAGMLWLAHSLEVAPAGAHELRGSILASLAAWRPQLNSLERIYEDDHGVRSAAISPDGGRVVTGSNDGRIRLWDRGSGKTIAERDMNDKPVTMISFSPDGSRILCSYTNSIARLWGGNSLEPIGEPLMHPDPGRYVWRAIFSPNGEWLATCGGRYAQLWDAKSGNAVGQRFAHEQQGVRESIIRSIAFNPDCSRIVTGAEDGTVVVWDVNTQKAVGKPLNPGGDVNGLAYSRDGSCILTGSTNGILQFWDATTLAPAGEPLQHGGSIRDADASPLGSYIASGGADMATRVWDAQTNRLIGQPLRHRDEVSNIDLSADETCLISASLDGSARLWALAAGRAQGSPLNSEGNGVAFSTDGARFTTGNSIFETATQQLIGHIPMTSDQRPATHGKTRQSCVAFSPVGDRIALADKRMVRIWNVANLSHAIEEFPHPTWVNAVVFSPNGLEVATAGGDGKVRLWSLGQTTPRICQGHDHEVKDVQFNLDGSWIVSGSYDNTARIWDAATLEPIGEPIHCSSSVEGVAVSPDSSRIAMALANGIGHIWSSTERTVIGSSLQHRNGLRAVAFSPDGNLVVSVAVDNMVRLWDAGTGLPVGPPLANDKPMYDVAYSQSHILIADRLWPVPPPPIDSGAERVRLWTEVITGMELDMDSGGAITALNGPTWQARRTRLAQIGGPPMP